MPLKDPEKKRQYHREHSREWYKRHKDDPTFLERMKRTNRRNRQRYMERWYQILQELHMTECRVCGYKKLFAAIEFHHTDPSLKTTDPGLLLQKSPNEKNTERLLEELKSCVPLCANCHREVHAGVTACPMVSEVKQEAA
jgi:hypothetical protein